METMETVFKSVMEVKVPQHVDFMSEKRPELVTAFKAGTITGARLALNMLFDLGAFKTVKINGITYHQVVKQ